MDRNHLDGYGQTSAQLYNRLAWRSLAKASVSMFLVQLYDTPYPSDRNQNCTHYKCGLSILCAAAAWLLDLSNPCFDRWRQACPLSWSPGPLVLSLSDVICLLFSIQNWLINRSPNFWVKCVEIWFCRLIMFSTGTEPQYLISICLSQWEISPWDHQVWQHSICFLHAVILMDSVVVMIATSSNLAAI